MRPVPVVFLLFAFSDQLSTGSIRTSSVEEGKGRGGEEEELYTSEFWRQGIHKMHRCAFGCGKSGARSDDTTCGICSMRKYFLKMSVGVNP